MRFEATVRAVVPTVLAAVIAGCADQPTSPVPPSDPARAALAAGDSSVGASDTLWNRYVVTLRAPTGQVRNAVTRLLRAYGGRRLHVFDIPATEHAPALRAFVVDSVPESFLARLRTDTNVVSVEPDVRQRYYSVQPLPGDDSQWALDQIDQRSWPRDRQFYYFFPGTGVHMYIADTGIRCDHSEFAGRIGAGASTVAASPGLSACEDRVGHGTGVAGAAAGTTYGVAKAATVHPVRMSYGSSLATTDAVAALDWIRTHVVRPAVVNYSASGDSRVRDAIQRLLDNNITVIKAAGEGPTPRDACADVATTAYPLLVVGAVDRSNARTSFSDYGSCVRIFAPGLEVKTADYLNPNAGYSPSGTSYAAPLVAGVAAGVLQQLVAREPNAGFSGRVFNIIRESGTQGVVIGANGASNVLLNSLHRYLNLRPVNGCPSDLYIDYGQSATCNWSVDGYGGDGTWADFRWERSLNGGPYALAGTTAPYSETYAGGDYTVTYRVSAQSFGAVATLTWSVRVRVPKPCRPPQICPV